jgi:AcrR family transcriptional regulator
MDQKPNKSSVTRDRIVEAALALFNAQGEAAVTTNHIARALGMSPGNLYYHFKSKDAIIAALFDRLDGRFRAVLLIPQNRMMTIEDAVNYTQDLSHMLFDYRFIFENIATLVQRAEPLQARYRQLSEDMIAQARAIYAGFVNGGFMTASDEDIDRLADNSWVVLAYWLVHRRSQTNEPLTRDEAYGSVRQLMALFAPMLKPEARAALGALKV